MALPERHKRHIKSYAHLIERFNKTRAKRRLKMKVNAQLTASREPGPTHDTWSSITIRPKWRKSHTWCVIHASDIVEFKDTDSGICDVWYFEQFRISRIRRGKRDYLLTPGQSGNLTVSNRRGWVEMQPRLKYCLRTQKFIDAQRFPDVRINAAKLKAWRKAWSQFKLCTETLLALDAQLYMDHARQASRGAALSITNGVLPPDFKDCCADFVKAVVERDVMAAISLAYSQGRWIAQGGAHTGAIMDALTEFYKNYSDELQIAAGALEVRK